MRLHDKQNEFAWYIIISAQFLISHANKLLMGEEFVNLNDILNADLMPGSLLRLVDGTKEDNRTDSIFESSGMKDDAAQTKFNNGSFQGAFETMDFHRKMMNEYLCHNFLASEILRDVKYTQIQNRIGESYTNVDLGETSTNHFQPQKSLIDVKASLLSDIGSSNYHDWLHKTATLKDVYRHYDQPNVPETLAGNEIIEGAVKRKDSVRDRDGAYGDSGMYHHPVPPPAISGKHGGNYEFHHQIPYHQPEKHEHWHGGGGHGLADLFEVSLTGLAFLSFGMFVLQVLMCLTMNPQQPAVMQMIDNSNDVIDLDSQFRSSNFLSNFTGKVNPFNKTNIRFKRYTAKREEFSSINKPWMTNLKNVYERSLNKNYHSERNRANVYKIENFEHDNVTKREQNDNLKKIPITDVRRVNEIARRALASIDALLFAEEDNGACLKITICENNKFSKSLNGEKKFWIPLLSVGLSWLANKVGPTKGVRPLEALHSAALGLGGASCHQILPHCSRLRKK